MTKAEAKDLAEWIQLLEQLTQPVFFIEGQGQDSTDLNI